MSEIKYLDVQQIADAVCQLFLDATAKMPCDCIAALNKAKEKEESPIARQVLATIEENLATAEKTGLPICQDTGMAVVFAQVGEHLHVTGGTLQEAVNRGVAKAYKEGLLRLSIVSDPLFDRTNTGDNTPAILHIETVKGSDLTLTCAPKGFGSENMCKSRMFTPSATPKDIVDYVVDVVKQAGANPCPPIFVGVGLGSDFEGVALLSKKALTLPCDSHHPDPRYATMEEEMLAEVNALGIGPQGFGGNTTALGVHILTAPTHIAGLPCAVSISCHANRHASITL